MFNKLSSSCCCSYYTCCWPDIFFVDLSLDGFVWNVPLEKRMKGHPHNKMQGPSRRSCETVLYKSHHLRPSSMQVHLCKLTCAREAQVRRQFLRNPWWCFQDKWKVDLPAQVGVAPRRPSFLEWPECVGGAALVQLRFNQHPTGFQRNFVMSFCVKISRTQSV